MGLLVHADRAMNSGSIEIWRQPRKPKIMPSFHFLRPSKSDAAYHLLARARAASRQTCRPAPRSVRRTVRRPAGGAFQPETIASPDAPRTGSTLVQSSTPNAPTVHGFCSNYSSLEQFSAVGGCGTGFPRPRNPRKSCFSACCGGTRALRPGRFSCSHVPITL